MKKQFKHHLSKWKARFSFAFGNTVEITAMLFLLMQLTAEFKVFIDSYLLIK